MLGREKIKENNAMNEALSGLLGALLGADIALLGTMLTNKLE